MRPSRRGGSLAQPSLNLSFSLNCDKSRDGFVDRDAALSGVGALIFEIDPPFIEAIDHLHAWRGVLHALRAEGLLPF